MIGCGARGGNWSASLMSWCTNPWYTMFTLHLTVYEPNTKLFYRRGNRNECLYPQTVQPRSWNHWLFLQNPVTLPYHARSWDIWLYTDVAWVGRMWSAVQVLNCDATNVRITDINLIDIRNWWQRVTPVSHQSRHWIRSSSERAHQISSHKQVNETNIRYHYS